MMLLIGKIRKYYRYLKYTSGLDSLIILQSNHSLTILLCFEVKLTVTKIKIFH